MSRGKTVLLSVVILLLAGGAGLGVWYWRGKAEAEAVTKVERRDLPVEEIRQKLQSGNFREKLEAKKQIGKLTPEDRVAVLRVLLTDPQAATRLIAVSELGKLEGDAARAALAEAAEKDADEMVRAAAKEAMAPSAAPPAGGAP